MNDSTQIDSSLPDQTRASQRANIKTRPRPRTASHYLLFDRIDIQDANAISSPITYGFPAVSGFLGAIHALSRDIELAHPSIVSNDNHSRLPKDIAEDIRLSGAIIACHDYKVHHFRPHNYADYTFNQTRNPVKKDGNTPSIIEQGRINLSISLVVEVTSSGRSRLWLDSEQNQMIFAAALQTRLMQKRIAGGSVTAIREATLFSSSADKAITSRLLPGFILDEAKAELKEVVAKLQQSKPEATAFDALIDIITLHHLPPDVDAGQDQSDDEEKQKTWTVETSRKGLGWLVPMPMGYQSISPEFAPGALGNASYPEYPSQYVEAIYGLGKWVFPTKIKNLSDHCWRYQTHQPDPENHPDYRLYLTTQSKP